LNAPDKQLRICQIGTGFVPVSADVAGGVEKYIHFSSMALQDLGLDVTVIDMPRANREKTNYRLIEVPLMFRYHGNLVIHFIRGILFGYFAFLELKKQAAISRFDIISFHSQLTAPFAIAYARMTGAVSVFTLHNPLWSLPGAFGSPLNRLTFILESAAERFADLTIFLNRSIARTSIAALKINPERAAVIPVGIDESMFHDSVANSEIRFKYAQSDERIVLCVGRIAEYKNQLAIIKAMPIVKREIKNVKTILVGPVSSLQYYHTIKRAIFEFGLEGSVIIAGKIPLIELIQLLHMADLVVMPSFSENMPQSGLEAMAAGKPIIFSRIESLTEYFTSEQGLAVDPHDVDEVAQAMVKLLSNEELRTRLGRNARRIAWERYRWTVIARALLSKYQDMVEKVSHSRSRSTARTASFHLVSKKGDLSI